MRQPESDRSSLAVVYVVSSWFTPCSFCSNLFMAFNGLRPIPTFDFCPLFVHYSGEKTPKDTSGCEKEEHRKALRRKGLWDFMREYKKQFGLFDSRQPHQIPESFGNKGFGVFSLFSKGLRCFRLEQNALRQSIMICGKRAKLQLNLQLDLQLKMHTKKGRGIIPPA